MKKAAFIAVLVAVSSLLFAQTNGSLRAQSLGGAYTGLADDHNALLLNPAGLAYLDRTGFRTSLGGGATLNFDLGYVDDEDNPEAAGIWNTMSMLSGFQYGPSASWIHKNFGISSYADLSYDIGLGPYEGEDTILTVTGTSRAGVLAGLGIPVGPLALGANVKLFKEAITSLSQDFRQIADGAGYSPVFELSNLMIDLFGDDTDPMIELGLGGLFTSGDWSVGVYLDNLLTFIRKDADAPKSPLETLSLGFSVTPSFDRLTGERSIFSFTGSLDFKNFASEQDRQLAMGMEAGLDIENFIVALARVGYNQAVPGPLSSAFSQLDPKLGTLNLGVGAKFWFLEANVGASIPGNTLFSLDDEVPTGTMDLKAELILWL